MANCLYNGEDLPNVNSVYTPDVQKDFPFLVMFKLGITHRRFARACSSRPYYNGSAVIADGAYLASGCNMDDDTPSWIAWEEGENLRQSGVFWTNTDILNTDGTLYLAARNPVPVIEVTISRKVDRYSYIVGFNLGLAGMAYPYSAPAPVAYLYNGIRLPALPEWDRGVYPFAVTVRYNGDGMCRLYVGKQPFTLAEILDSSGEFYNEYLQNNAECVSYFVYPQYNGTDWKYEGTDSAIDLDAWYFTPFWSNHDILKEDGTVYMAASKPVPVYE